MQEIININEILDYNQFKIHSDVENLELQSEGYFSLKLRIKNFADEASYLKFVRNCEKLVRGSLEYKLFREYVTDVLQFNRCAVTNESISDCTIEIHHHIPTLFVLIKTLINERIENGKEFCTFDICTKAIEIHFSNKIGYVPLLTSMHEKFTNGALDIPIELVHGNYKEFLEEYGKYISEEDFDDINKKLAMNLENCRHVTWRKDDYPGLKELARTVS